MKLFILDNLLATGLDPEMTTEHFPGPEHFKNLEDFLRKNGCSADILPYPKELEFLVAKYKSEANGFGALCFKRYEQIVGYCPYLIRKSTINIRLGEKSICNPIYDVIQILRPNSKQWGNDPNTQLAAFSFFLEKERRMAICATELDAGSALWKNFLSIGTDKFFLTNDYGFPHYFHYFEESYDAFYKTKSRNSRKQIKNKTNKLEKRLGSTLAFREYADEESVVPFLQAANSISVKTYQAKLFGELIENSDETRRLFTLYARYGWFRSFILWAGNLPISFILGFQTPDGIYELAVMGYDPEWYEYNAGFNCNLRALRCLYERNTPQLLDPGGGDNDLKRLLGNRKRESVNPILLPKSFSGAALYAIKSFSEYANRKAVSILEHAGIKGTIKRWLRK